MDDILGAVFDDVVGAESLRDLGFVRAAHGGNDRRARRLAELHGRAADAAGGSVDEQHLPWLDRGATVQREPRGLVVDEERRGLVHGHRVGDADHVPRVSVCRVGITAAGRPVRVQRGEDAVPG